MSNVMTCYTSFMPAASSTSVLEGVARLNRSRRVR